MNRRTAVIFLASALVAVPAFLNVQPSYAGKAEVFTGLIDSTGAGGYDVVAYHTDNLAKPGNEAIVAEFEGVTYRFINDANRATFATNPAQYVPAYGGYCAYAVSQGYTAKIDPEAFSVVNGRLYLNYSKGVQSKWQKDTAGYIAAGDANWPNVLGD